MASKKTAPVPSFKKTECPITRKQFTDSDVLPTVVINGQAVDVKKIEFSTGSFGFNVHGKVSVEVAGKKVSFQCSGNLVAIGSKDA